MEKLETIGEILPQETVEQLAKLFYKLGGTALNEIALDRMIDNPNIILGEN